MLAQLRADVAPMPVHAVPHLATDPVGQPALAALGLELDVEPGGRAPDLLSVRRIAGSGRTVDSEFELSVSLPLAATPAVELARIGDELAITVDGRRRLLGLPSVLRRCLVVGARQHAGGLAVRFRPDPDVWMR